MNSLVTWIHRLNECTEQMTSSTETCGRRLHPHTSSRHHLCDGNRNKVWVWYNMSSTVFYPHWLRLTSMNSLVTWIHSLNECTEQMTSSTEFYPEIPLCLFCTCFVVLFLKDGKHTSLSLPILDPTIEITSFVKSSLLLAFSVRSLQHTWLQKEFPELNHYLECDPLYQLCSFEPLSIVEHCI